MFLLFQVQIFDQLDPESAQFQMKVSLMTWWEVSIRKENLSFP